MTSPRLLLEVVGLHHHERYHGAPDVIGHGVVRRVKIVRVVQLPELMSDPEVFGFRPISVPVRPISVPVLPVSVPVLPVSVPLGPVSVPLGPVSVPLGSVSVPVLPSGRPRRLERFIPVICSIPTSQTKRQTKRQISFTAAATLACRGMPHASALPPCPRLLPRGPRWSTSAQRVPPGLRCLPNTARATPSPRPCTASWPTTWRRFSPSPSPTARRPIRATWSASFVAF